MAAVDVTVKDTEVYLRGIISSLYILLTQLHDHQGPQTQKALVAEVKNLCQQLVQLSKTARRLSIKIPFDIIEYVEQSRNPDIYTREFVELIQRYNQELKGRVEAFAQFRDILGKEMMSAMPEIKDDVRQVVLATGGNVED
ncbi:hypothetical protein LTR08_008822 [Meristemomyces frigidus]|nr:hypothetical protein LTR08_008822 [Meristemomyces frigidus]